MIKKLLFITIVIGFIAAIGYSYIFFEDAQKPISSVLNAIPKSASIIIETEKIDDIWQKLSLTNVMWKDLMVSESIQNINRGYSFIDSLYRYNPGVTQLFEDRPVYITAHMSGADKFNFLFLFSLPPGIEPSAIHDVINDNFDPMKHSRRMYEGAEVIHIKGEREQDDFAYTVYSGIFIGSFSALLVEEGVRQIRSGTSLMMDEGFVRVRNTAGQKIDANVFVRYKEFPNLIQTYLSPQYFDQAESIVDLADWTEVDVKIKPSALLLNGFSYSSDQFNNYLNIFKNQTPQKLNVDKILPFNTASMVHFGFSDFKDFKDGYLKYLEKANRLFDYGMAIKKIDDKYKCQVEQKMLSWVANEIAAVITEPSTLSIDKHSYVVFHANDIALAIENIDTLVQHIADQDGHKIDTVSYNDYKIGQIKIPNILSTLLGNQFRIVESNYYTAVEDYIVFANSERALMTLINYYKSGRVMDRDLNFKSYEENIAPESNILIYSNIARSTNIYQRYTSDDFKHEIAENIEIWQKFEAVCLQIVSDKEDLFYNNIYLKHNPVYKKETTSLWEVPLDANLATAPQLMKNHYTGGEEVFIEDKENRIYLLGNAGSTIWQKNIGGKIMGSVNQIDAVKNGKLQILFGTADSLYLIDRKGNFVDNFPIKLPTNAAAELTVFDFDNNQNYRILIPTVQGDLLNFDAMGDPIKGWEFKKGPGVIRTQLQHVAITGKDYLVCVDDKGNVRGVSRKGEDRLKISNKLPVSLNSNFFIEKGKSLSDSYIISSSKSGSIQRLSFDDKNEQIQINKFTENHYFVMGDINHDGTSDYVFADGKELSVYDVNKKLMMQYTFNSNVTDIPRFFDGGNELMRIGITCRDAHEIYLVNFDGTIVENFPLAGETMFDIGDINKDGNLNLVVGNLDKNVYTYTLER